MPVVSIGRTPPKPNPEKVYTADLTDKKYKHSIVDTKRAPVSSIITQIEGTSWSVDYYSQILGEDEEPSTYDPNQTEAYQQYNLIKGFELKLQGALSTQTDPVDQNMTITGQALIYPQLKPNYGDAFIADMGDGNAGIFTITELEKKSYYKQAVYEVSFSLQAYVSEKIDKNITSKVVKTSHFIKDFVTYGQNPVLSTNDNEKLTILTDLKNDLLAEWLITHYSVEFRTILMPLSYPAYDPFVTELMTSIFDKKEHYLLKKISLINTDDHNMKHVVSVWDALIQREKYLLDKAFRKYGLISPKQMSNNPFVNSSYYSGLSEILVPLIENKYTDERFGCLGFRNGKALSDTAVETDYVPNIGSSYVFSNSFYGNTELDKLTKIEHMIKNYFDEKANNWEDILRIHEDKKSWTALQKFYFVPVLLILIINEIRSI